MTSLEACGDSPRPFLGSPVAGVAAEEIIDASPALAEIKRRFIGNPEYSNLPRKFKTSASGHPSLDCVPSVNDVSFVGTVHPELGPGFDLWVGGGLSTNPMLAQKLGVWIPLDEVADAWEGVTAVFRDYGYRRLRSRARLKFLVADWGVEKFRQVLEQEYLHKQLVDCPSPEATQGDGDHIGVHPQKDGRFYVGAAPVAGRVNGATITGLGDVVEKYGAAGARLTAHQKVVVLGVAEDDVEPLIEDLRAINLDARPSNWRRATMACTGIEFCKLAIVETKQRAIDLVDELEQRFPELDTPISINVNGCPNACARTQVADIGLKGMLVMDDDGHQVEGFQVHLGGALGLENGFGKKLRAHKVTSVGSRRLRHHRGRQLPRGPRGRRDLRDVGQPRRGDPAARREVPRGDDAMSERAVPFHCPYCGDENLFPHATDDGAGHGAWECRSCLRAFKVSMIGQLRPPSATTTGTEAR